MVSSRTNTRYVYTVDEASYSSFSSQRQSHTKTGGAEGTYIPGETAMMRNRCTKRDTGEMYDETVVSEGR